MSLVFLAVTRSKVVALSKVATAGREKQVGKAPALFGLFHNWASSKD